MLLEFIQGMNNFLYAIYLILYIFYKDLFLLIFGILKPSNFISYCLMMLHLSKETLSFKNIQEINLASLNCKGY